MVSGPCDRRDRGDRDIVFEDVGSRSGSAATPVDDDVVDSDGDREINVVFNMLGRHFYADWNSARCFTNFGSDFLIIFDSVEVWEPRRADRVFAFFETANFSDLADNFCAGQ